MKSISLKELSEDVEGHLARAKQEPLRVEGEDIVLVSVAALEARALLAAADAVQQGEGRPVREVFDELYQLSED